MCLRSLVVEDDASMAELIRRCLQDISSTVVVASTFDEAMDILRVIPPPDLITLDLSLCIGGSEATIPRIHEIREANESSVIIVLTGAVQPIDKERILAAGADAVLFKYDMIPMKRGAKGFFGNFMDALDALVKQPSRYSTNVKILELLAERLAKTRKAEA